MPERQCSGCTNQVAWGCDAEPYDFLKEDGEVEVRWMNAANGFVQLNGEDLKACPRQHLKRNPQLWSRMFLFYGMYKQGFLPDQGAVVDQSNFAMEVFRAMDAIGRDCDDALDDERNRKNNQEARLGAIGRR
jgi:hypothetical protein